MLVGRGVRHELRNTSGSQARLRTEVTPAGRLEEFLTESARAAREGLYNARNLPTGLRGAAWLSEFALRFADETVMCSPPPALQRVRAPRRGPAHPSLPRASVQSDRWSSVSVTGPLSQAYPWIVPATR